VSDDDEDDRVDIRCVDDDRLSVTAVPSPLTLIVRGVGTVRGDVVVAVVDTLIVPGAVTCCCCCCCCKSFPLPALLRAPFVVPASELTPLTLPSPLVVTPPLPF